MARTLTAYPVPAWRRCVWPCHALLNHTIARHEDDTKPGRRPAGRAPNRKRTKPGEHGQRLDGQPREAAVSYAPCE